MPTLEDGQLFERYRIHKWLGSGIAGESYEAEDRILQRKVTLKLIHPWAMLSDSARRQFFREMQGISLLNHPYLATVLDYGETDGRMYVVRRYVSSGSLLGTNGRLWFHPPLPAADAFTYAHQLAQALQYIHQHGYLHGSLTFANVLVLRGPNTERDTDYAPFLMADIGLANFVRRFGHPRIETLPISAAPEQLNKRVTPASDQFALAVLLYFWLAGRPPYLGTPQEVEQQKLSETITPLSILNPGITLEQDALILRALTAYPEERHASVLAFTEELLASLSSPNRHFAHLPAPQHQTPPLEPQAAHNTAPAHTTETEAPENISQTAQSAMDGLAEEISISALPSQLKAEPRRSALEELLALPQSSKQEDVLEQKKSLLPDDEKQEDFAISPQEEITLFPVLPETPPVGDILAEADFTFMPSGEPAETHNNRHTGPLAAEPPIDVLYTQVDEPMLEMPLELPEQLDFSSLDELPPALREAPPDSWSDDSSASTEEEIPTVPQEEFARARREHEQLLLSNEQASWRESVSAESAEPDEEYTSDAPLPDTEATALASSETDAPDMLTTPDTLLATDEDADFDETSTPMAFSSIPLPSQNEADQANLPQEFAVDEEGFVVFSPDDFAAFNEMISPVVFPDEPLPLPEETAPTIPLAEPVAAPIEQAPAPSSSESSAPSSAESTPAVPLAETFQESAEDLSLPSSSTDEHAEQAPGLVETGDTPVTDVAELFTNEEIPEEIAPITPLGNPVSTPEEDIHAQPSDEATLLDEEDIPTVPQTVNPLVHADMPVLAEELQENPTVSASVPALDGERELPPRISAPLQEAPETSSATYAPIDEAVIAPRLLISSPYTSSSYEFLLIGEETNIGRAGASDLYLEQDNLTSRHHALLKRAGERVLIVDKHSHNGVFLNGQKIEAGRGYELADGDHIGIGNYELIFRSAPAGHVSQLI